MIIITYVQRTDPLYLNILFCPSVLWHCWLGYLACKNRPRNDLLCVGWTLNPIHSLIVQKTVALYVCVVGVSSSGRLSPHCGKSVAESRREGTRHGDDLRRYWQPGSSNFVAERLRAGRYGRPTAPDTSQRCVRCICLRLSLYLRGGPQRSGVVRYIGWRRKSGQLWVSLF